MRWSLGGHRVLVPTSMEGSGKDKPVHPPSLLALGVRLLSCHEVARGEGFCVTLAVCERTVPTISDTSMCSNRLWAPSFYKGLPRPSYRWVLRGGITYPLGLRLGVVVHPHDGCFPSNLARRRNLRCSSHTATLRFDVPPQTSVYLSVRCFCGS